MFLNKQVNIMVDDVFHFYVYQPLSYVRFELMRRTNNDIKNYWNNNLCKTPQQEDKLSCRPSTSTEFSDTIYNNQKLKKN
ncbi:hypothetical protein DVH24_012698 [Malus domestica]|uniref:Uncharacterized protein n=1 Tax=Malus domestica TaxID=3750 RepID=A0A498HRV7_MALDO|nr:hypothetical protein DVH24_012698 [Malus domestica]